MWRVCFEDKRQNQAEIKNSAYICSADGPILHQSTEHVLHRGKANAHTYTCPWIQTHPQTLRKNNVCTVMFSVKLKQSQPLAKCTPFSQRVIFFPNGILHQASLALKSLPGQWSPSCSTQDNNAGWNPQTPTHMCSKHTWWETTYSIDESTYLEHHDQSLKKLHPWCGKKDR